MAEECDDCGDEITLDQSITYVKHDGSYHVDHVPRYLREPTVTLTSEERVKLQVASEPKLVLACMQCGRPYKDHVLVPPWRCQG